MPCRFLCWSVMVGWFWRCLCDAIWFLYHFDFWFDYYSEVEMITNAHQRESFDNSHQSLRLYIAHTQPQIYTHLSIKHCSKLLADFQTKFIPPLTMPHLLSPILLLHATTALRVDQQNSATSSSAAASQEFINYPNQRNFQDNFESFTPKTSSQLDHDVKQFLAARRLQTGTSSDAKVITNSVTASSSTTSTTSQLKPISDKFVFC